MRSGALVQQSMCKLSSKRQLLALARAKPRYAERTWGAAEYFVKVRGGLRHVARLLDWKHREQSEH